MTHRVALLGMMLESNTFAPVATEADFRARSYLTGAELAAELVKPVSSLPRELVGFYRTMNATGPWQPVPILETECEPSGPVDQAFFERTIAEILAGLTRAAPLDAVYVANHGAMTSTESTDPDGEMLERIRGVVGPGVPIVVTLDLHANISDRMAECSDVIIGYLTNPHVDMLERGEEAAHVLRWLLAGGRAHQALVRLPLTPPSIVLLSAAGPYGELIDYAQRRRREHAGAILSVSVFGGFVFSDTPENGLAVVVTSRGEPEPARALAVEIAARAWAERQRYRKSLTALAEAVALALATGRDETRPAIIFSDAGDNPGGGGGGNTIWLLEALHEAGATGVLCGSFFDPPLAAEAHERGVGARFEAVFNRAGETDFAKRLSLPARVLALGDGQIVGRRGLYGGRAMALGPTCALALGAEEGITAIVISARRQTADPMFFEQFGLDVAAARVVCVKSRGHFRAGFDEWFAPAQVYEVDTAGLTSPVLDRIEWRGLPRPVYPLDEHAEWTP